MVLFLVKDKRNDQQFEMGPIVGWVDQTECRLK